MADELGAVDNRHDALGGAVYFLMEAYLRHPDSSPAMVDAAKKIRAAIIPALDRLTATYETEAKNAKEAAIALPSLAAEMAMFPVPGGTLADWAHDFVAQGHKLDTLLSQRADRGDRKAAGELRADALGVLNRLRKSLALERKQNKSLPASLEDDIFGYLDLLETNAATAYAEEKRRAKAAKAAKAHPAVAEPTTPAATTAPAAAPQPAAPAATTPAAPPNGSNGAP
jgi:hypothetical protein